MSAESPHRLMVRRAMVLGTGLAPVAFLLGAWAGGLRGGWSGLLGAAVAVANFAVHGLSLAWAAGVSIPVLHAVALGGVVVRMGGILAVLVVVDRTGVLSAPIVGVSAVAGTLALLVYEARLVLGGVGAALQIPPEPAAADAAERLRAEEASR